MRDVERFNAVVRACPLQAHWLDGEPITEVLSMAGVLDRYRRFVVDGETRRHRPSSPSATPGPAPTRRRVAA